LPVDPPGDGVAHPIDDATSTTRNRATHTVFAIRRDRAGRMLARHRLL
jgi:hypothetical protein